MNLMELIKELRSKTGAGFMNCKNALKECNNNLDEAVDWIRKKGLTTAVKKSDRTASEGVVALCLNDKGAYAIEINSETDFVAKNEKFRNFAKGVLSSFVNNNCSLEELKSKSFGNTKQTVEEELANAVSSLGENIVLRKSEIVLRKDNSFMAIYSHNTVDINMGRIGVIVELASDADHKHLEKLEETAKFIAMHISAMNPIAIRSEDISKETIEKEKEIIREQEKNNGVADDKLSFMVENKIKGFFKTASLLDQPYICHNKLTVGNFLKEVSKEVDATVEVKCFKAIHLGASM